MAVDPKDERRREIGAHGYICGILILAALCAIGAEIMWPGHDMLVVAAGALIFALLALWYLVRIASAPE